MSNREHWKQLLPIIQAYVDGKDVQFDMPGEGWIQAPTPTFGLGAWRIKPEPVVLKYRRYLWNVGGALLVDCVGQCSPCRPDLLERLDHFVRWIDTEWQTYEVTE